jgi:glycosyltransferase involved in cell wall biosynthesis
MDLVSQMLFEEIRRSHSRSIEATLIRPSSLRLFDRIAKGTKAARTADRGFDRFIFYPRVVWRVRRRFDLFHIIDHSYAHLAHLFPQNRTVVTCHDLDAFRCLIGGGGYHRRWYPMLARRLLSGMQRAAAVICVSRATRDEIVRHGLVDERKLFVIPNGVDPACSHCADPEADRAASQILGPAPRDAIEILHVGSTIARKRIDTLLEMFSRIRNEFPQARLIRIGGAFSPQQERDIDRLSLRNHIVISPFLTRRVLAAIYRRAAVTVITSESEGFGLPVCEAMACGTPVVCSDIPALREVGGGAATYCQVGDVEGWAKTLGHLFAERASSPEKWQKRRTACLDWVSRFSWASNANETAKLYRTCSELTPPLPRKSLPLTPHCN